MFYHPMTLIDAKNYRYGCWAGNPRGTKYENGKCAFEVRKQWNVYQCTNRAIAGPEKLYCKMHAKIVCGKKIDEK
jgi:hypothetical protein